MSRTLRDAFLAVPGWLSEAEGRVLQDLARNRSVLEIGAWQGRSTIAMAAFAGCVTAVDHFRGDDGTGDAPPDLYDRFRDHVDQAGVADRVVVVAVDAADLAPVMDGRRFDMVFVDGSHDAASVERDTRLALAVLDRGGVLAWHDWTYASVQLGAAAAGIVATRTVDSLGWTTL